ncbi:MAG: SDR family oxidoreductase [Candidatus Eremiobacteraeota bacterium]|nr:SDR family oxidoreductase [Candidatus Eremiobacteraeota bacterium]
MNPYYRDKLAWIFGGSQGIGLAIGEELVKQGCRVRLWARRVELLEKEAARIRADWTSLDVSDYQATETAIEAVLQQDGTPQFIFNCAGLALPGYLLDLSAADIATMNQVNYLGTAYVCKAVLPALVKQRAGHIVNVSSLGGLMGLFGYTGYCGSKYAVMGFSEALRREVSGYGIRVTTLCPPKTRTPGLDQENLRKPPEVLAQEEKVQVLEAAQVARYLLKALPANPFTVIPSFDGRLAHLLSRWAPGILNLFLKRPPAK